MIACGACGGDRRAGRRAGPAGLDEVGQRERPHAAAPGRCATSSTLAPARRRPATSSLGGGAPAARAVDRDDEDVGSRPGRSRRSRRARRGARGAVHLHQVGAEAGRADQLDRAQRRGPLDVEARAVALLDRGHRRGLPAPGERPDDREAGGDRRAPGAATNASAPAPIVETQQRPQAVEQRPAGLSSGSEVWVRALASSEAIGGEVVGAAPEPEADQRRDHPPAGGDRDDQVVAGAVRRRRA